MNNSLFSVRTVMRVLSLFLIVVYFCPTFLVSCAGENVDISAMSLTVGFEKYGERLDPYFYLAIFLILPVVMLALLFAKKNKAQQTAMLVTACGTIDLVLWFIFKNVLKSQAEERYCVFNTTNWFIFNNISLIAIIILGGLVLMRILHMDKTEQDN